LSSNEIGKKTGVAGSIDPSGELALTELTKLQLTKFHRDSIDFTGTARYIPVGFSEKVPYVHNHQTP
jgi:hypothetical protein